MSQIKYLGKIQDDKDLVTKEYVDTSVPDYIKSITEKDIEKWGKNGVYVGGGEMPDDYNIQIDPDGENVRFPAEDVVLSDGRTVEEAISDEVDPTVPDYVKAITENDIEKWNDGGIYIGSDEFPEGYKVKINPNAGGDKIYANDVYMADGKTVEEAIGGFEFPKGSINVTAYKDAIISLDDNEEKVALDGTVVFTDIMYGAHKVSSTMYSRKLSDVVYLYKPSASIMFRPWNIPPEYSILETLKINEGTTTNTNYSYINTMYIPNRGTGVKLKYDYQNIGVGVPTGQGVILGCRASSNSWCCTISGFNTTPTGYFGNGQNNRLAAGLSMGVNEIEYDMNNGYTCKNADGLITHHDSINLDYPSTYNYPLYLGCFNDAGKSAENLCGAVYFVEIYQNDDLIKNYRPVMRKVDGVVGFYETVNGVFMPSATNIPFTAGEIIYE